MGLDWWNGLVELVLCSETNKTHLPVAVGLQDALC